MIYRPPWHWRIEIYNQKIWLSPAYPGYFGSLWALGTHHKRLVDKTSLQYIISRQITRFIVAKMSHNGGLFAQRPVCFTDKSRFRLSSDYGHIYICRESEVLNYLSIIIIKRDSQMNSLAASVKLTYSASMVDRLTDFCLKVRDEIGVSSIKVMNPPIDTRSSLFVAKSESE
ncbi:hypothetical protein TNCV_2422191 [Trichonephila clavipes]|nr:hypothetical protein TNCV_2422191 [Trichonephila clavipes]